VTGVQTCALPISAEYCGTDDTIFVSQKLASDIWRGMALGKTATYAGRAFGVAYVISHEYGHNVQAELGISSTQPTVSQMELQADCFAGVFANSEYSAGALQSGDVARAISTAALVGDTDFASPQHHGTSAERVTAWKLGYNSGDPNACLKSFSP